MDNTINEITDRAKQLEISEPAVPVPVPLASSSTSIQGVKVPEWSYAKLLGQRRFIQTIKVKKDEILDSNLFTYTHSFKSLGALFPKGAPQMLNLFKTRRWRVNFEFMVESSWQHVGLLSLYSYPLPRSLLSGYLSDDRFSLREILQLPHQFIKLGHNGTYSVSTAWCVPFSSHIDFQNFADKVNFDFDSGSINLDVVVPLRVASGVLDLPYINVWATIEFEDLSMYAPYPSVLDV